MLLGCVQETMRYVQILAVGYLTLVFLKAIKEEEKLVIHIKTVPFVLMDSDVCDYSMYSVCALFYF